MISEKFEQSPAYKAAKAIRTLGQIVKFVDEYACHVAGKLNSDIWVDCEDIEHDVKIVIRWRWGHDYFELSRLHGLDLEKNCWTVDAVRVRVDLPSMSGKKKIEELFRSLLGNWPGRQLAAYRNADHSWRVV